MDEMPDGWTDGWTEIQTHILHPAISRCDNNTQLKHFILVEKIALERPCDVKYKYIISRTF